MRNQRKLKSSEDFWASIIELNQKKRYDDAAKIFHKFYKRYPDPSIKVRMAEANRLSGDYAAMQEILEDLDISFIHAELGLEFGSELMRQKVLQMKAFPEELYGTDSRQVLDGFGKIWESGVDLSEANQELIVYEKKSFEIDKEFVFDPFIELELQPPFVIHSDTKGALKNRDTFYRPSFQGGLAIQKNVIRVVGSNSALHLETKTLFVDEYRSEFPILADPKNDPFTIGVRENSALCKALKPNAVTHFESGFWLAGSFMNEWAHFVFSYLVQIWYFQQHPLWKRAPLFVPDNLSETSYQFLSYMIGDSVPVIRLKQGQQIGFEIVVSMPSKVFSPGNVRLANLRPPEHVLVDPLQFIRMKKLLEGLEDFSTFPTTKKVFMDRSKYGRRELNNRTDVERICEKHGFKSIDLAVLNAPDQAKVWKDAEKVVGDLGAWHYLSVINDSADIIALNSDWDFQCWGDVSSINKVRSNPTKLILGKRDGVKGYSSLVEEAPHKDWSLSEKGIAALDQTLKECQ
jgi:hypothetical protein